MFATPIPQLGQSFFTAASMMIVIPSGVQIFCWLATLWGGKPYLKTPLLFVLGFITTFVLGGLTGVMLASVPLDLQVHDTFFVVAHLHYVLIGGAVFPLFAALYYWFPKWTGRMLGERMGKWNFWILFVGFNLTFFPMHQLGLKGMPRRVYTYPHGMGWGHLNLLASLGAATLGVSVLLFLVNVFRSWRFGEVAGDDPWGADSLEWGTSSPPPSYNFVYPPVVQDRYALWAQTENTPVVTGLRTDCREVLVTNLLDAEPDHRYQLPGSSIWPLALALAVAVTFIGVIFTPWAIPVGAVLTFLALLGWFWPNSEPRRIEERRRPPFIEKPQLSLEEPS
jgi:cytochrome c oxidase subunit 1